MGLKSVRYSALSQEDQEDQEGEGGVWVGRGMREKGELGGGENYSTGQSYGMPEGTFKSAFTYANYNDLDRMGYQEPKRYGQHMGSNFSRFTYSSQFNTDDSETQPMNTVELIIYAVSMILTAITLPFSLLFVLKFVSNTERLVVLRLGRAQKLRGPGATWVVPCIDTTHRVSMSITAFNVPPSQIITIDRGLVEMGATVFLKIRDPVSAICGIQDRNNSTRTVASAMLYRMVSKKRICEITNGQDRRIMAAKMKEELQSFTGPFGVEITEVEVSDAKVMKEGENMGMSALSAVARSETGQQLWKVIEPHVSEFAQDAAHRQSTSYDRTDQMSESEPSCSSSSFFEPPPLVDLSPALDMDHIVTVMNMAIDEHLTRAVGKVFQVNCSGLDPIYIDLKHPPGICAKGTSANADVTFETTQLVFFQLIKKTVSPINAYMDGSLKIRGSVQDALMLKYLAERVSQIL